MAHILVIDDEEAFREALGKILARAGHRVTLAANGKEGIASVANEHPDLVITDIFMPEKDGIEVTIMLRHTHPAIKVIAVSGGGRRSNFDFLETASQLGAHAALHKPLRMKELLETVDHVLAGR